MIKKVYGAQQQRKRHPPFYAPEIKGRTNGAKIYTHGECVYFAFLDSER